jgi:hypothetical protein
MRIRTGNRRRARVLKREWVERDRQWRLKKLKRLVLRHVLKAMVKHFEDLILYGSQAAEGMRGLATSFRGLDLAKHGSDRTVSGLYLGGKFIGEVKEISLVDYPARPWGGGPEVVMLKKPG